MTRALLSNGNEQETGVLEQEKAARGRLARWIKDYTKFAAILWQCWGVTTLFGLATRKNKVSGASLQKCFTFSWVVVVLRYFGEGSSCNLFIKNFLIYTEIYKCQLKLLAITVISYERKECIGSWLSVLVRMDWSSYFPVFTWWSKTQSHMKTNKCSTWSIRTLENIHHWEDD